MNGSSLPRWIRAIAAVSASSILLATGCTNGTAFVYSSTQNAGNFSNTIFIGDSLTAGYQNGSLCDKFQPNGWAPLVAKQAGFTIVQPLIAPPGAPNYITLVSVGPPPVSGTATGTTTGRDNFAIQPTDLAVPGANVQDAISTVPVLNPTAGQQQITQLVLGYPGFGEGVALSQMQQAIRAQPTTIFLWIGNNDALIADIAGTPAAMTSVANFTQQYQSLVGQLTANNSVHLVIANIPDVTLVPYLTPAATLLAQYSAATSIPQATLSTMFGISAGDLVNPSGLAQISAILGGTQHTTISDAGFLSAAEVVTVRAQVTAYNQVITSTANAIGATLVDINALFATTAANGIVINGVTANFSFLGGLFSMDGIHPTNTGYALLANKFIDAMNAQLKTSIADVSLSAVATTDPLFGVNIGHIPFAVVSPAADHAIRQTMLPSP
ncbi:MAG: SGNH/GDSL hydrolase family protein [Acidobacteriaceae bacterium]|nr:SGNH/GDSL hydrolase family protein [Acidobacteriaceae bacterium]